MKIFLSLKNLFMNLKLFIWLQIILLNYIFFWKILCIISKNISPTNLRIHFKYFFTLKNLNLNTQTPHFTKEFLILLKKYSIFLLIPQITPYSFKNYSILLLISHFTNRFLILHKKELTLLLIPPFTHNFFFIWKS